MGVGLRFFRFAVAHWACAYTILISIGFPYFNIIELILRLHNMV